MKTLAVLLVAALIAANAQAAPRKIDDCEAIAEPMAYNACLASFGPTRGHSAAGAVNVGGGPQSEAPRSRSRIGFSDAAVRQGRSGRIHMEFTTRHGR